MWRNSHELLMTIHDAHARLKNKETDAPTAHAEARLLGAATRMIAVTLEHARLTNRLNENSALLPMMSFDVETKATPALTGNAQPQIETKP